MTVGGEHVLVVGGTGILAPAVQALAARGAAVSVVSRSADASRPGVPVPPSGLVVADVTDTAAFGRAVDEAVASRGPVRLALAYQPFAPQAAWELLAERTEGLMVALLVSAFAAEGAPPPPLPEGRRGDAVVRHLLLGWHRGPDGSRWHTPAEVSEAALRVAGRGESAVLGTVTPWSERPGH
ncbi:hypothetical protein [Streptomyces sp. NPDC058486]|uniref:hypothetical protein n=1 Tax=unclassified Streptomyces TaxID=2593676 RepID=UPI00364B2C8E